MNHQRITKESLKIYSGKIVKEKGLTKPNDVTLNQSDETYWE